MLFVFIYIGKWSTYLICIFSTITTTTTNNIYIKKEHLYKGFALYYHNSIFVILKILDIFCNMYFLIILENNFLCVFSYFLRKFCLGSYIHTNNKNTNNRNY